MNYRKIASAALVLAGVLLAASAANVVGTWEGSSNDGENDHPFTLTLRQDGGTLKGDINVNGGDIPLDNLKVDGQTISWDTNVEGQTYKCQGTIAGDSMTGTFSSDERSGTWQAKRQKEAPTPAAPAAPATPKP